MPLIAQQLGWEDVAKATQAHLADTISKVSPAVPDIPSDLPLNVTGLPSKLLDSTVIEITESTTETLLTKLSSGEIKSEAVTNAFLQRAGLASKLVNCITELLPESAIKRAQFLDEYLSEHKQPIGPLHGLPISVKEHVAMKGLDLNAGFISWVGTIAQDDALILKLLWKAGAVFYARTTQPQSLMHLETSSNIHGVTTNPYNTKLTSGGSSGGEGALIGFKGSCLGIGTDIGGSIRSPAAANGVFGLRPSTYRLPLGGLSATMIGQEQIVPVIGPLSTSLEGVKVFMKTLIDQKPWLYDPMLVPLPWKGPGLLRTSADGKRKLRIGVLADDGVVKPHPPILRAINYVVSKLKDHPDFEIVEFPPYKHDEAWRIISSLYFSDGGKQHSKALEGEPWRPLTNFIIKDNPNVKPLSIDEVWSLSYQRDGYRAAYAQHWNSVGTKLPSPDSKEPLPTEVVNHEDDMVDVILAPAGPGAAPPIDCARYWGYLAQWNLLDYPAMIFPTGLQCGADDKVEEGYQPRNEKDEYNYKLYKPETYVDAPISLQLVGKRYQDEKVVEALEMIIEAAGLPTKS